MASLLGSSVHAMAVTFAMIAMGTVLRALGVVTAAGQREMSQATVKLLLPAFNFSALVTEMTWARLEASQGVAAFAVIHMLLGLVLGSALCAFAGRSSPFLQRHRSQVLVLCAFCNGTAMPLTLFRALASSSPQLVSRPDANAQGALDITVYGTVWRFLLWTVGIALLEVDAASQSKKTSGTRAFPRLLKAALLNSNTMASVLGFGIALGPPGLRALFIGGPLTFVGDACANIAKASHTMLLLSLGAALWPVPGMSDWRGVAGVCAAKLVAMPLATLALLRCGVGARLGLGPMSALIVAIEGCVPSALQISMMVQSVGQDVRTCTVVCFWQHVAALLTMTTFLALALGELA